MSIVEALWRYHLNPFLIEAADAVRRKPWLFVAVAAMVAVVVLRPGAARLEVPLPPGEALRGAVAIAASGLTVALLAGPVAALGGMRKGFYFVGSRGRGAWRAYVAARLTGSWAAVTALVGLLTWSWGIGWLVGWVGGGVVALLGAALQAPSWLDAAPARLARSGAVWGSGVAALWASAPARFTLPWLASAVVLVWAWSGGAGFVWADHPPVAALLTDLTLPTLAALLGAEAPPPVPYRVAWLARAPWTRVLFGALAPGAVLTLGYVVLAAAGAATAVDAVRAIVVNATGVALWVFWGLRVGSGSLFTLAVSWGWLTLGLVADAEFWGLWSAASAVAALGLATSWVGQVVDGTRAREETHG